MHVLRDQWSEIPYIEPKQMTAYDAFLLGIPTRFGNMPAQWKVSFLIQVFGYAKLLLPGILGQNGKALDARVIRWQVCRSLLLDLDAWGRTRNDRVNDDVDTCASWDDLRASWVFSDLQVTGKSA